VNFNSFHSVLLKRKKLSFVCALLLILFFSLSLFSCRDQIEEAPWNNEVVPVVFSSITPSETIQVYIGKSYSESDDKNNNDLINVKVFVAEKDSAWVELVRDSKDSSLFFDQTGYVQVKPGKTYFLKADIGGTILNAQTTVPSESGEIIDGKCVIVPDNKEDSSNFADNTSNLCVLSVTLKLPTNRDYGCYLTAFSERIDAFPFLSSSTYQHPYFVVNKEIGAFDLNIVTVDPNLKKFFLAEAVTSSMFVGNDITEVFGSYGGVFPFFSNIENGLGIFGSFIKSSKLIIVTDK